MVVETTSYELRNPATAGTVSIRGFNPVATYEAAIASLDPELARRPAPESVTELLTWAQEPLATAEIVAVMAAPAATVRTELGRVARPLPAGADFYWELPARPTI